MDNSKPKLVLLDIDDTLFDAKSFRKNFKEIILQKTGIDPLEFEKVENLVYSSMSIFETGNYLHNLLTKLDKSSEFEDLKSQISDPKFLKQFLFEDVFLFAENVAAKAKIGILSRGDNAVQRSKITPIENSFDLGKIYIFGDKKSEASSVVFQNKDFEVYFIDNDPETLKVYKNADPNWTTILIERYGPNDYNYVSDFKIASLMEAVDIVNK